MIVIHATLPVDTDSRERALERLTDLAEKSRAEEGVIDYRMTTDIETPNIVRVFEQYEDEAAVETHLSSEHFQQFQADAGELLADAPSATRFDVESTSELL